MHYLTRLLACVLLWGAGTGAWAQLVVPEFGARGDVSGEAMRQFMDVLRQELSHATGLEVLPGELVTQGIASSLEGEFAYVIAHLGGGRYGLSGELARSEAGIYTATVLVADEQDRRASDLLSYSFVREEDFENAARFLALRVNEFIHPPSMLAEGDAELFVSSLPTGAAVFVRGVRLGETGTIGPLGLEPGEYEVEFRKEGYLLHTETVQVEPGGFSFLHANLTPASGGSLQVTSRPRAEVFLEGRSVGRTPVVFDAPPGEREIRLERPGFLPEIRTVPVRNHRINRLDVSLRPIAEPLIFWEPVRGTLVFINGLLRVDSYVEGLGGGLHTIELWRGAERATFRVVLTSSGVYELDFEARRLVPAGSR